MSKFTPGPWRVGYESFCVESEEMKVCDIRGWGHLTGTGGMNLPDNEAKAIQEANAALIAAAPELYDALLKLLNHCAHIQQIPMSTITEAQYALLKAGGQL